MVRVLIGVDPRIAAALRDIAKAQGITRTRLIRNALYECVRAYIRDDVTLPNAPTCGPIIEGSAMRVYDKKLISVDEYGLLEDHDSA
jgi:hypothetical protein